MWDDRRLGRGLPNQGRGKGRRVTWAGSWCVVQQRMTLRFDVRHLPGLEVMQAVQAPQRRSLRPQQHKRCQAVVPRQLLLPACSAATLFVWWGGRDCTPLHRPACRACTSQPAVWRRHRARNGTFLAPLLEEAQPPLALRPAFRGPRCPCFGPAFCSRPTLGRLGAGRLSSQALTAAAAAAAARLLHFNCAVLGCTAPPSEQ
jgi:hypothetical protein